jgi:soluble lytic murein transglycosylase-like protein
VLARELRRVVVKPENADRYRAAMRELLELSARRELDSAGLDSRYRPMFVVLVKSTAWQESCWRQFVEVRGEVRWLESRTGDIGLMQVNKYVWRGLYNLELLRWDVLYNAGAGAEILMRMMRFAMARRTDASAHDLDSLARSTYAAYNGGPVAHDRWRRRKSRLASRIDSAFWEKYSALRRGGSFDVLACAATWPTRAAN